VEFKNTPNPQNKQQNCSVFPNLEQSIVPLPLSPSTPDGSDSQKDDPHCDIDRTIPREHRPESNKPDPQSQKSDRKFLLGHIYLITQTS
jgi:hypothetical protein